MNDVIELCGNPADEVYLTQDDFGIPSRSSDEPAFDELPFEVPRD